MTDDLFRQSLATAILGVDTLWGGDVLNPSGVGRFIADCWFSDDPLPVAYADPSAARVRVSGGVSAKAVDRVAIDAYLSAVNIPAGIDGVRQAARQTADSLRARYLVALADCFAIMWDLAMEILGEGRGVPFARCVHAATGRAPAPSDPARRKEALARLLEERGERVSAGALGAAVDAWRRERVVAPASFESLAGIRIAELDRLTRFNLMPHLPGELTGVPRANIRFLPIEDAWFSGSMNYLGRARTTAGQPEYDATYEINASLDISIPEFEQLLAHEVEPGHVTTFAFLQNLYVRRQAGFEASVLTMNTRAATLFEGIANNALLIAQGVTEVEALDDPDAQVGLLLAQLQDEAKNHAAWLTWQEGRAQADVASVLRRDFLVSEERAQKLAGAWGRHPLLGRMCLPAYHAGTEAVARLRREYPPASVLPALYGCRGVVDIVTVVELLGGEGTSCPAST